MPLNDLDLEQLTELAGTLQQLQEVGQQLAAFGLSPRFDLLTGLYDDADGKKLRRFKREDVLAALKSLTAGKAA